jgi:L-ascorbate metabolism protein UlaG (beta-lactamase superfamily)
MEIYWLGHGCFRLRGRDATVLTNPCPPSTGYKIGKVPADIVTVSRDHPDSNYRQAVSGEPKFLMGQGEYEISAVLITGVRTDHRPIEQEPNRNIAYVIDLDDIRICHLGDISQVPAKDDAEVLSAPDILLIPVGGGAFLDAEKAAETVSLLDPKIVIPMNYRTEASAADLDPVDKFLREMGSEAKTPEARLNITRSAIPGDTTLVLLNYRGA